MTREDIMRWATHCKMPYDYVTGEIVQIEKLEAFAALVSKQERWRGFNDGYKQAIKDCVVLLMIQHEMAKGSHNYYHVAAQLIQADLASDT